MEKIFGNEDVVSTIKTTVAKRWLEKSRAIEENSHEKMYMRMVDEAVLLIKNRWEADSKYNSCLEYPADVIEVKAYNSFFITKDLDLCSESGYKAENPKTKKCCFFDAFIFSSEEEKQRYIQDVLKQLPEGTSYDVIETSNLVFGDCEQYTFKLKISMT